MRHSQTQTNYLSLNQAVCRRRMDDGWDFSSSFSFFSVRLPYQTAALPVGLVPLNGLGLSSFSFFSYFLFSSYLSFFFLLPSFLSFLLSCLLVCLHQDKKERTRY
ncbi:uncharacterized protein K452DRAFT_103226 [Aplosporella prunicola CBS 121167]|uniref:Uncharacterized protein n=1 Tax=Aplosporella prunicola CBS 121167 TaxID=1176127 RepID=A0A6A6BQ88_9PEZI|nr:uncharacterized protein K452DRAFT_103226 [Aplosporella prunicola CBS 121167]KAF2145918.1 hypothetical protein K452DRAFT_103226 [Aplosporella prunicola CBS 121167]